MVRLTEGDDEFEEFDGPPRTVFGLGGDDDIFALSAGSIVDGGDGDDFLAAPREARGGPGGDWFQIVADVTNGGPGDDRIEFDPPSGKQVSGGTGRDTFVMLNGSSGRTGTSWSTSSLARTSSASTPWRRSPGGPSAEVWNFIGRQDFDDARQVRYETGGGETLIEADEDGDGTADFFFEIPREVTLQASDFRLGVPTGTGPDSFAGTPFADIVNGFAGDDDLRGAGGIDRLLGGEATTRWTVVPVATSSSTAVGTNTFLGGPGDDEVFGGEDERHDLRRRRRRRAPRERRHRHGSRRRRKGYRPGWPGSDTLHGDAGADWT